MSLKIKFVKKKILKKTLLFSLFMIFSILLFGSRRVIYGYGASIRGTVEVTCDSGEVEQNGYYSKNSTFRIHVKNLAPQGTEINETRDNFAFFSSQMPGPGNVYGTTRGTILPENLLYDTYREVVNREVIYEGVTAEEINQYRYICMIKYDNLNIYEFITGYQEVPVILFDETEPVISNIAVEQINPSHGYCKVEKVSVLATDGESGLAAQPYSFDNGQSFQSENVCEVVHNGEMDILVKDAVGNISRKSIQISGIDDVPPVLDEVRLYSDNLKNGFGSYLRYRIKAHDEQLELAELPFSTDEGRNYSAEEEIIISENGIYPIWIKDSSDNILYASFEATQIDKEGPVRVSENLVVPDNYNGYGKKVIINPVIADEKAGLAAYPFSWDMGSSFSRKGEKTVYENGTYSIVYKDALNNLRTDEIEVSLIDQESPIITDVHISPVQNFHGYGKSALIQVSALDGKCGLAQKAFSFDRSITYQAENYNEVNENGNYGWYCRDGLGNKTYHVISVNCIDREAPLISNCTLELLDPSNQYARRGILKVEATDEKAGLDSNPYSFDYGKHFVSENEIQISENGVYQIVVEDGLHNAIKKTLQVSSIDTQGPSAVITGNPSSEVNRDVILQFALMDAQSGIESVWMQNDEVKAKTLVGNYEGAKSAKEKITITSNGTYRFFLFDTLGNLTEYVIPVTAIKRTYIPPSKSSSSSSQKSSSSSSTKEENQNVIIGGRKSTSTSVRIEKGDTILISDQSGSSSERVNTDKENDGKTIFIGLSDNQSNTLSDNEGQMEQSRTIIEEKIEENLSEPEEKEFEIDYPKQVEAKTNHKAGIIACAFGVAVILMLIILLWMWKMGYIFRKTEESEEEGQTKNPE